MLAKIERPSRTAGTIVAKLSSARIMLAASFVTSVPVMPMATPMSADLSAGASFTPSPVMATMLPSAWSASTMRSLCSGATRAKTLTPADVVAGSRRRRARRARAPRGRMPIWSAVGCRGRPRCGPRSAGGRR